MLLGFSAWFVLLPVCCVPGILTAHSRDLPGGLAGNQGVYMKKQTPHVPQNYGERAGASISGESQSITAIQ